MLPSTGNQRHGSTLTPGLNGKVEAPYTRYSYTRHQFVNSQACEPSSSGPRQDRGGGPRAQRYLRRRAPTRTTTTSGELNFDILDAYGQVGFLRARSNRPRGSEANYSVDALAWTAGPAGGTPHRTHPSISRIHDSRFTTCGLY